MPWFTPLTLTVFSAKKTKMVYGLRRQLPRLLTVPWLPKSVVSCKSLLWVLPTTILIGAALRTQRKNGTCGPGRPRQSQSSPHDGRCCCLSVLNGFR